MRSGHLAKKKLIVWEMGNFLEGGHGKSLNFYWTLGQFNSLNRGGIDSHLGATKNKGPKFICFTENNQRNFT
jgi:hypothetical protein